MNPVAVTNLLSESGRGSDKAIGLDARVRKQLGQWFTGMKTSSLLAALTSETTQTRILDPMAGHGDLTDAVVKRLRMSSVANLTVTAVEIEPRAAEMGRLRMMELAAENGRTSVNFQCRDAFDPREWHSSDSFDLVIANPPYVRYQEFSQAAKHDGFQLRNAQEVRQSLEEIAESIASKYEIQLWQEIIKSYSGLADLSLPSWVLSSLMVAPSGMLGLIVPQSWFNREYSRIARYMFLRFFEPVVVVKESGQRWFDDAQVPVCLVVGRRLDHDLTSIPLHLRQNGTRKTSYVDVSSAAASKASHVGATFSGPDPDGQFASWLRDRPENRLGITVQRIPWIEQLNELAARSENTDWFRRLEGARISRSHSTGVGALPLGISDGIPLHEFKSLKSLSSHGICVGQGLRTGCNKFFYVDVDEEASHAELVRVKTHKSLGGRELTIPSSMLIPVLRRQTEIAGVRVDPNSLSGRLLDLRRKALAENVAGRPFESRDAWSVMSDGLAKYVRDAETTDIGKDGNTTFVPHLTAVSPNGLCPRDRRQYRVASGQDLVRMWYMIPDLTRRHTAPLLVPRINHKCPEAILNVDSSVVVDANFSTLWCNKDEWSPYAVFALLTSTWARLCMEAMGSPLGGGALKLEAAHLRQLPMPSLSTSDRNELERISRHEFELLGRTTVNRDYVSAIDSIVISALVGRRVSAVRCSGYLESFRNAIDAMTAKRRKARQLD